MELVFISLGQP